MKVMKVPLLIGENKNNDEIFNGQNKKLLATLLILLIPCSLITIARNSDWKDTATLFSKDIEKAPESALLNYNYGNE
jgi:hypothetical protein